MKWTKILGMFPYTESSFGEADSPNFITHRHGEELLGSPRFVLVTKYVRTSLAAQFPSLVDTKREPSPGEYKAFTPEFVIELEQGIQKTSGNHLGLTEGIPTRDDISPVGLHLARTVLLMRKFITEIRIHNSPGNSDSDMKILSQKYFDGLHPLIVILGGYLHDFARHWDNSSAHDDLLNIVVQALGVPSSVKETIYRIHDSDKIISDPSTFDINSQRLLRVADLFSKKVPDLLGNTYYQTSVKDVCERAAANQLQYFNQESEIKRGHTYWSGKTYEHYLIYIKNEELLLGTAVEWLERVMGKKMRQVMGELNTSSTI